MSDLLGDFAGALDQFFLCEGVVGAALQGSGFGPQIGSHIKKQVGDLGFSCTGLVTKQRQNALEGLQKLVESW